MNSLSIENLAEEKNMKQRGLQLQNSTDSLNWDTSLLVLSKHYVYIVEEWTPGMRRASLVYWTQWLHSLDKAILNTVSIMVVDTFR